MYFEYKKSANVIRTRTRVTEYHDLVAAFLMVRKLCSQRNANSLRKQTRVTESKDLVAAFCNLTYGCVRNVMRIRYELGLE